MSRIFCIVGKSCSGKDTLYKAIVDECRPNLIPIIPYTTRPKRNDEIDGLNYHFVTVKQLQRYEKEDQIVEKRQYNTTQGIWTYFTLKFSIDEKNDYIVITTLAGAQSLIEYYGSQMVNVIYLYVEDRIRLLRCIERESLQKKPDYTEICRRFVSDQQDFSTERLEKFENLLRIDTGASIECCISDWDIIYEGY